MLIHNIYYKITGYLNKKIINAKDDLKKYSYLGMDLNRLDKLNLDLKMNINIDNYIIKHKIFE